MRLHKVFPLLAVLTVLVACTREDPQSSSQLSASGMREAAAAHYASYGRALATPRRSAIAGFYHPDGALIVFNGDAFRQSQAELKGDYEGQWNAPAFFEWEKLTFDSIAPNQMLVTGGFRWLAAGQRDTARYIYAGMLVPVDSGVRIVFEHETLRPKP